MVDTNINLQVIQGLLEFVGAVAVFGDHVIETLMDNDCQLSRGQKHNVVIPSVNYVDTI